MMEEENKAARLEYFLNMYKATADDLNNRLRIAVETIMDLGNSMNALESIEENALFPLGAGVWVRGKTEKNTVLAEIGSDVVIEKSIEGTKQMLNERKGKMEKIKDTIELELNKVIQTISALERDLEKEIQRLESSQAAGNESAISYDGIPKG